MTNSPFSDLLKLQETQREGWMPDDEPKPLYEETTILYKFQRIEGHTEMCSPCTYRDLDACRTIAKEILGNREFVILRIEETYKEFVQE